MPSVVSRMDLGRGAAKQHHHIRRKQFDLAGQKRRASGDLLRCRRAVSRRPPIDRVGDVDRLIIEPDGAEHTVEQLACAPDERLALQVFVAAWRLSDQHDARLIATARKACGLRRPLQSTAVESGDRLFKLGERFDTSSDGGEALAGGGAGRVAAAGLFGRCIRATRFGAAVLSGSAEGWAAKRSIGASPMASSTPMASYQASRLAAVFSSPSLICDARFDPLFVSARNTDASLAPICQARG